MNLKSVLLHSPLRVGGAPAAKKYEHGGDVHLAISPPFVVIGRRVGGEFYAVGVPIGSVGHVEFAPGPIPGEADDADATPATMKDAFRRTRRARSAQASQEEVASAQDGSPEEADK